MFQWVITVFFFVLIFLSFTFGGLTMDFVINLIIKSLQFDGHVKFLLLIDSSLYALMNLSILMLNSPARWSQRNHLREKKHNFFLTFSLRVHLVSSSLFRLCLMCCLQIFLPNDFSEITLVSTESKQGLHSCLPCHSLFNFFCHLGWM